MPNWKIIQPQSKEHWDNMYDLRYRVLRKEWNQPKGSEKAEDDTDALHAIVINTKNEVIACCRAHASGEAQVQLRYMAVDPAYRGMGLGKAILLYIEKIASIKYQPLHQIILHARENAVNFYKSNGYEVVAPSHVLFNSIQHYLMAKSFI